VTHRREQREKEIEGEADLATEREEVGGRERERVKRVYERGCVHVRVQSEGQRQTLL
jgi:hypothetical protein